MKKKQLAIVIAVSAVILLLIFSSRMFFVIQPGERGVIFRPFTTGLDKENIQLPGFHIVAPWNDLSIYDVKEQKAEETMDVLDKNGLKVIIETSVRFNPIYKEIGSLHEIFGKFYVQQLVVPEVRSSVRQVAGRYSAEEIYSTKRSEVEKSIVDETNRSLTENFIDMRALLIRSINLPTQIQQAIESKLTQEQEFLAYQFKLESEKSEAERRRIAAEGESRANKIINSSLTSSLLKMRGIEATIELAKSPNTKVIVIGSGKDGLPLILGNN
ncbi:MAG: prohibitin family protein [Bacteroidales bacterium]|jgi:regulator of protease activity HflC (stomatin/prohibitin superfamily)|nr:prohibitin family protein [Bacteroidales bacterium]MDD4384244.1 prohibitin family protein [Bacteroidales bacterium]MDY0197426.1 prohibitin family protein [Tenuifilaceae bacterium]